MAEKEPTVSWQVLLDDAQWEREARAPAALTESAKPRQRWGRTQPWLLLGAFLLVLALLSGGLFLWQRAQQGLTTMQQEIEKVALLEATGQTSQNPMLAAALLDPLADPDWRTAVLNRQIADKSAPPAIAVQRVELNEGTALAQLLITDPDLPQASRVVRFYRDDAAGWLRTQPVMSFWGGAETWEGEHFLFRYYARDRAAVLGAGSQVEMTYIQMRRNLGLPILSARQIVVVRPDDRPLAFDFPSGELRQPSPQLLNLPASVSDEDALFRSLTIYLINELVRESFDRYGYGQVWMWSNLTESGLRNWLQLESGVLKVDRYLLLPWLLERQTQDAGRLPAGVAEECQTLDGLDVRVLLLSCTPGISTSLPRRSSVLSLSRLTTTYELDFTRDSNASNNPSGSMWRSETRQEIAAATTIYLYAVETYGVERFPALLEELGNYRGWTEALPAAYGVTAEAFEEGWRGWLAEEFGVRE